MIWKVLEKVKDLGSSNGTYINNGRVEEAPLQAGDRLAVGPIVFTVQVDGMPSEIAPCEAPAAAVAGGDEIIDLQADMLDDGEIDEEEAERLREELDDSTTPTEEEEEEVNA